MPENIWAATGPDWYRDALCKNVMSDLFTPTIETAAGCEKVAAQYCNVCPSRERCLQFAIIHGDRGYWGGVTTADRQAMRRVRTRAKCPVTSCRAPEPVKVGLYQVCLRCGASWQAERATTEVPLPA